MSDLNEKEVEDVEPIQGNTGEEKEEKSPEAGDLLNMDKENEEETPKEEVPEEEKSEEEKESTDEENELERTEDDQENDEIEEEKEDVSDDADKPKELEDIDVEKDHDRFSGKKEQKAKEDFFKKQQEKQRKQLLKKEYEKIDLLNQQEARINSESGVISNRMERIPEDYSKPYFDTLNRSESIVENNAAEIDLPEAKNPIEFEQRKLSERLNKELGDKKNQVNAKQEHLNKNYFEEPVRTREVPVNNESLFQPEIDELANITSNKEITNPIEYKKQRLKDKLDRVSEKSKEVSKAIHQNVDPEKIKATNPIEYERQRLAEKLNQQIAERSQSQQGLSSIKHASNSNIEPILSRETPVEIEDIYNEQLKDDVIAHKKELSNPSLHDNKTSSVFKNKETVKGIEPNKNEIQRKTTEIAQKEKALLKRLNNEIQGESKAKPINNIAKNISKQNYENGFIKQETNVFGTNDEGSITKKIFNDNNDPTFKNPFDKTSGIKKKLNESATSPINAEKHTQDNIAKNVDHNFTTNKQISKNQFIEKQQEITEKNFKDKILNIGNGSFPNISVEEQRAITDSNFKDLAGVIKRGSPISKGDVEYLKSAGRFVEKSADGKLRYISQKEYEDGLARQSKRAKLTTSQQPKPNVEKKKLIKIGGGEVKVDSGQETTKERRTITDKVSTGNSVDSNKILTGKDSLLGAKKEGSLAKERAKSGKMKEFLARRNAIGAGSTSIFGTNNIATGGKAIIQSIGKKALTAGLATSITVGGLFGGATLYGGRIRNNNSHVVQPVQAVNKSSKDANENMMEEMATMLQERLKAYYKILRGEELTEEEKKKAGSEYVPLQDITITKATLDGNDIDPNSITMSNLKNFSAEYNLSGDMTKKDGSILSGLFKKNIKVSAVIPTYDFVDGEGNTIGSDKFLLSPESDIVFPNGTAGKAAKTNTTVQNTSGESSAKLGSETQMDIMLNMLGAMETGGQIYGQRDYGNVINAEAGGEVASTIGWSSLYANNAKNFLIRFREENRDKFTELDKGGIIAPLLEKDWIAERVELNTDQTSVVKDILLSNEGKKLQDKIAAERVVKHWNYCANTYTTNLRAVFWYTQLAELGGGDYASSPVDAVFQACDGDYSTENILKQLKKRNQGSQIGASLYNSRHEKYKKWIDEKIPENMEVDLANVEVTGAGAIDVIQAGTAGTSSSTGAGQLLFVKEILSMGAVASHSGDPRDNHHFQKYCITLADYAIAGHGQGITVEIRTTASGQKESWVDEEGNKVEVKGKKLVATVKIPVLCDLARLQENDTMFNYSWDLSNKTYGDKLVQSYIALKSSDFEKVFNVKIKALSFGYVGGSSNPDWADGFGGISNLPYVKWAREIAADDSHGYSWVHRLGNPDYDCSSLVYYALTQAGFNVGPPAFSTYSQINLMTEAGFVQYEITSPEDLRPGDILWRQEHTEIYIGGGRTVGAHIDEVGGTQGAMGGDQTGEEISESATDWRGWTYGFHPPAGYNPTE